MAPAARTIFGRGSGATCARAGGLEPLDLDGIAEERTRSRAECPYAWDDILDRPFDFDSVKR